MKIDFKPFLERIKNFVSFIKDNKEIGVLAYFIGITIQILILLSILGFSGLSYLSISFSLILFTIILFLFFLSIPTFILFLVFLLILSFVNIWNGGLFGKAFLVFLIIILFSAPYLLKKVKFFGKLKDKFEKNYNQKIDRFYMKSFVIIFIIIFIGFIGMTFSFKVATIKLNDNKEVFGKYLFYNQNYYFLDICGKKLVIPTDKVESVEIEAESYELSAMKLEEKNKLNEKYDTFCKKYLEIKK